MKRLWVILCFVFLGLLAIGIIHSQDALFLKWQRNECGQINASPAIGNDGTIYVGNRSNAFFALNPDGSIKWSYDSGSVHDSSPAVGADGTIYVAGRDVFGGGPGFKFFAIKPDGTPKWIKAGIGGNSSPGIGPDGTVYFSSSPYNWPSYDVGAFYAFIPDNGTIKWSYPVGGDASPTVGSDGTVYHVSGQKLYAFSPNNGSCKWICDPQVNAFPMASVASPIVDADGTIYFAVYNVIIVVNSDGTLKWKKAFPSMRGISELSLSSNGTLYFCYSGSLHALDTNTKEPQWSYPLNPNYDHCGAPTVGLDGNVYVVTLDGYFIAVNSSGNLVKQIDLGGAFGMTSPNSSPAIGPDGTAYIGGGGSSYQTNGLYAIQTTSSGPADSPWPKFRHDNHNSGRTIINTPPGSGIVVQPTDPATGTQPVALTFSNITQAGTTGVTISHPEEPPPAGFLAGNPPTQIDITSTAAFSGPIQICMSYEGISFDDESNLKLLHYENGTWVDITISRDSVHKIICGSASSLSPFGIFQPRPNRQPLANAGSDQSLSAGMNGKASVILNGSASSDPDGDALTYLWTWNGGNVAGVSPTITLPLGTHLISLVVNDGKADSAPDTVIITVKDETPPLISKAAATPSSLWPPNKKLATVTIAYDVADNCDPLIQISSKLSVNCNETIGPGDFQVLDAHRVSLRADRDGNGTGRIYTITITCKDTGGNSSTQSVQVRVPHDQGK